MPRRRPGPDMPATEPAPSGTCFGVGGAAGADEVGGRVHLASSVGSAASSDMAGSSALGERLPLVLQPARPSIATAMIEKHGECGTGAA